jgi:hypothetical protein
MTTLTSADLASADAQYIGAGEGEIRGSELETGTEKI